MERLKIGLVVMVCYLVLLAIAHSCRPTVIHRKVTTIKEVTYDDTTPDTVYIYRDSIKLRQLQ